MSSSEEEEDLVSGRARTLMKLLVQGLASLLNKAKSFTENDYPLLSTVTNSGF